MNENEVRHIKYRVMCTMLDMQSRELSNIALKTETTDIFSASLINMSLAYNSILDI